MLFIHTVDKVLDGSKTATSRIVKPGDHNVTDFASGGIDIIVSKSNRYVYELGKDYAVQPGRGMKSVGRIRITGIERYDVRTITPERARLEGFSDTYDFLCTWVSMHDKRIELSTPAYPDDDLYQLFAWAGRKNVVTHEWHEVEAFLAARPAAKYDAWFLTFELLKDGE